MTDPIFFRYPEHPTGRIAGYHHVIDHANGIITTHLYESGHCESALRAAKHCSDRHPYSHVRSWDQSTGVTERAYESHPVKHDIRPGVWDGPVGTTVTVRGPGGCFVQAEL